MGRDIAADYGTGSDHRSLADCNVRQNDAMWPNENVLFNYNFPIARWPSGSGIKVGNNRRSETDC